MGFIVLPLPSLSQALLLSAGVPFLLLVLLGGWALTLPGITPGLLFYLVPKWHTLLGSKVSNLIFQVSYIFSLLLHAKRGEGGPDSMWGGGGSRKSFVLQFSYVVAPLHVTNDRSLRAYLCCHPVYQCSPGSIPTFHILLTMDFEQEMYMQ